MTCVLGAAAYAYLPHGAAEPKTFFGRSLNIFSDREAAIIVTRVIRNDPTKAHRYGKPVQASHIMETFRDWRLYGHLVSGMLSMIMIAPMNTYAPSIIKSLGFTSLQANGLNSVGSVCALILSVSLAFSSGKFRERGLHIAAGYLWGAAGLLWLALAPEGVGKWGLYGKSCSSHTRSGANQGVSSGGVVWTQMGMGCAQAISAAWLATKMQDYKRPTALAAYVMSIQLANFPGNQLFRQEGELNNLANRNFRRLITDPDAPRYTRGLIIAASCAIAASVVMVAWKLLYRVFDNGDGGVETDYDIVIATRKETKELKA